MSAHIEWLAARETSVQVFTPGDDWIGAGEHRQPVLTLAGDEVVAIQGTPAELRALAARITAVASAASRRSRVASRTVRHRCAILQLPAASGGVAAQLARDRRRTVEGAQKAAPSGPPLEQGLEPGADLEPTSYRLPR